MKKRTQFVIAWITFLILLVACNPKPSRQLLDTIYPFTVVSYLSKDLNGVEITGVFPLENFPVFVVSDSTGLRRLSLDMKMQRAANAGVLNDSKFSSMNFADPEEDSNGMHFNSIVVQTAGGKRIPFQRVMFKRPAIEIGHEYFVDGEEYYRYRRIEFTHPVDSVLDFTSDIRTGDPETHSCKDSGMMSVRNNIAYYHGLDGCEMLVVFKEAKLQIFQISGKSSCGCGTGTNHDGEYNLKQQL